VVLGWQAVVHGYFPPDQHQQEEEEEEEEEERSPAIRGQTQVLQRSRGTHAQGGHLTLLEKSLPVPTPPNIHSYHISLLIENNG
jgi:hypothetical protein